MPPTLQSTANRPTWLLLRLLLLLGTVITGCSESDPSTGTSDTEVEQPTRERVARARIIGTPVEAAYLEGIATVQKGPDPTMRESLVAPEVGTMLVAVRVDVSEGEQTFIPGDYEIEVKGEAFSPVAVSFGDRSGVFFSVDELLTASVEIREGPQGRVGLAGDRISSVELPQRQMILLYKSRAGEKLTLYHGQDAFPLPVADTVAWLPDSVPSGSSGEPEQQTDERKLEVSVVNGELQVIQLQGERTEIYALELKVRCPLDGVEISPSNLFLNGPSGRTRQFLFSFDEQEMRMKAGSEFSDLETSSGELRRIFNGGVRIGVHGGTIPLKLIFPQPPFETGFDLQFADLEPIELISRDSALGEIRPAFVEATLRVPRARLVGEAAQVAYLTDGVPVVAVRKRREMRTAMPGSGKRFLALRFNLDDGDQKLIANDYELIPAEGESIRPSFLAAGLAPAEETSDNPYEAMLILPSERDGARFRRGEMEGWEVTTPVLILVWEVPADATRFRFSHGETQLTLQPAANGRSWKQLRPANARDDLGQDAESSPDSPPAKDSPLPKQPQPVVTEPVGKPAPEANSTAPGAGSGTPPVPSEQDLKKAASLLRMSRLVRDKDAVKAREYLNEILELVPGSDLAREARSLLEELPE